MIHSPPSAKPAWPPEPAASRLANGLRVLILERTASPLTELRLVIEGGFGAEPGGRSGAAGLAMAMFSEGALRPVGGDLRAILRALGATIGGRVTADASTVAISALALNLERTLALLGSVLSDPTFEADEFAAVRERRLALIARETQNPSELASRVLPAMLFPAGHPYARPFSGSGGTAAVAALDADRIHAWYARHLLPSHATLVVAGGPPTASITSILERTIGRWEPATGDRDTADGDEREAAPDYAQSQVLLAGRTTDSQAGLFAGLPTPPPDCADADALIAANAVLAGMFTSRLNLRMREDHAWSYGVRSSLLDARAGGWWLASTFVHESHAVEAMDLINAELEHLAGRKPCTGQELTRAVNYMVGQAHSRYETCAQAADALARLAALGLPAAHDAELGSRLRRLKVSDITRAAARVFDAQAARWLITGDAEKLAQALRATRRGTTTFLRP